MKRKNLIIIVVCLVATVLVSLASVLFLSIPRIAEKYESSIVRRFNTPEEEDALKTVESFNYTAICMKDRFYGSSDPQAYLQSGTYLAYTSANYVDSVVIEYYQTRYNNLQGKGHPRQIELDYEANVTKFSQFQIYNSPAPEGVAWHNVTIVMSASNGLKEFNSGHMQFFFKNQTGYQVTKWDYDFNFSDCYVVDMKLSYSEVSAPVAGFFVTAHQIVVLDKNSELVLLGLESGMAVS